MRNMLHGKTVPLASALAVYDTHEIGLHCQLSAVLAGEFDEEMGLC